MKGFIRNLVLVLVSSILAFLGAEVAFRAIQPAADPEYRVKQTANQYDFYRFDEKLGWSNAPLMTGQYRRREFSHPISINAHGMRQGPVNRVPDQGVFRIAFLGDSFLWGVGVSDQLRFSDIIGRIDGIEALNFGVAGYAPVQYLLELDDVISFRPGMVVIALTSNDFDENVFYQRWTYYKPYFALNAAGDIELRGYPLKNTRKFGSQQSRPAHDILERSLIVRTLLDYMRQKMANDQQQGLMDFESVYLDGQMSEPAREARDQAILINKKILERIKRKLDENDIPMVVIFSPSKREYMINGRYGAPGPDPQVAEVLETTLKELGIDFINTFERMNLDDFWLYDGHWRPQGHFKMARALQEYLIDKGYTRQTRLQ